MREDKEFQEFRDLMKRPDKFQDGFNIGTVLMGMFVGLVMAPASVYMNLVAGLHMGSAAQWVTVLLYVEVARRAFKKLKRPEIFVLFYMCGAAMAAGGQGWLWRQFLVQSEELRKMGVIEHIPAWFAPIDPTVLAERNFFMMEWMWPIAITCLMMLLQRIDHFGLGYVLFRVTADVEERIKLYEKAQLVFKEQAPWVTIAHSVVFQPVRKEVVNWKIDPFGGNVFSEIDLKE